MTDVREDVLRGYEDHRDTPDALAAMSDEIVRLRAALARVRAVRPVEVYGDELGDLSLIVGVADGMYYRAADILRALDGGEGA